MEKQDKNNNNTGDNKLVTAAMEKCRGTSKRKVLRLASKLNAEERLAIIKHFEIEPQNLASTITMFWLRVEKSGGDMEVLLRGPFFTE